MIATLKNKPESIDWSDMNFAINDHCTVGELLKNDYRRIPSHQDVKENLISLATSLKFLKVRSQIPFVVTMGYVPSEIARFRGYANEYREEKVIPSIFSSILCHLDYYFNTNFYENLQWTLGEWTRRHPITQGRWLSIMPTNAEGIIIYDPNTALSLLKECERHWDGKAVLSENKLWIGLSI